VALWHADGGIFANYAAYRQNSLLPYHNYPTPSSDRETKKRKPAKLLQNNYMHLLGNIP